MRKGMGEVGVGPDRKTLCDFIECTHEEKIHKVYSFCKKAGGRGGFRFDLHP